MAHGIRGYSLHILGCNEIATGKPGTGPCTTFQGNGPARAGTPAHPVDKILAIGTGCTARFDELDDIFLDRLSEMKTHHLATGGKDIGLSKRVSCIC